jgi:hypothetical protein
VLLAGGVGFTLPPEISMLTALAPCELWQSLPSTHGGKAMELQLPVLRSMPGLGMNSDAAAAGGRYAGHDESGCRVRATPRPAGLTT